MPEICITAESKSIPVLLSLPFPLGTLAIGLFFLAAFGAPAVTAGPLVILAGLKVSFFDVFIVLLVFAILLILNFT